MKKRRRLKKIGARQLKKIRMLDVAPITGEQHLQNQINSMSNRVTDLERVVGNLEKLQRLLDSAVRIF